MPGRQPPVIQSTKPNYANAFPLSRLIPVPVRAWLIFAILTGLAAGRGKDAWRAIADKDPDIIWTYPAFAFAALGVVSISYCLWRVIVNPSLESLLGMKRSYWLLGVPLAWLCGVGIGLLWRYV